MTELVKINNFYELLEKLQAGENVPDINLENYNIGTSGVKQLIRALRNNNTVKSLYLCNNAIDDDGIELIADF
ncbi:MAG: hypothetical protein ACE1S7_08300, partial [Candidatus Tisiphia sp.]